MLCLIVFAPNYAVYNRFLRRNFPHMLRSEGILNLQKQIMHCCNGEDTLKLLSLERGQLVTILPGCDFFMEEINEIIDRKLFNVVEFNEWYGVRKERSTMNGMSSVPKEN